jgi:uncharacterized protein (TIGR02217 family)
MAGFVEERLLDCVAYGTQGGPTWKTRKNALRSGIVRRNPLRSRPLYRYTLVYRNLMPEHFVEVRDAFNACMGGVFGFRIKDWADFEATNEVLPVLGTGALQSQQLVKTYSFGGNSVARNIRKPVAGTVVVTANNVPISATIDTTTGIAQYTATNGAVVRWSGEFDVPVMFSDDEMPFAFSDKGAAGFFLTGDVTLEEDLGE